MWVRWGAVVVGAAGVVFGTALAAWYLDFGWPDALAVSLIAAVAGIAAGLAAGSLLQERALAEDARRRAHDLERAARDLATRERYLDNLFQTAPVGVQWLAADGRILRTNPAAARLLECDPDCCVGRRFSEFETVPGTTDDLIARLVRGETISDLELRLRTDAGALRNVLISASALIENDAFVHARCFMRDVTDLRRGEEALSQKVRDLSLALRAGTMGFWTRDLAGAGQFQWSPELERLFGLPPGAFAGDEQEFLEFVHPDDRAPLREAVAAAIHDHADYQVEFRYLPRDGGVRWMLARGRAEYDAAGAAVRLAGVGIDITERKHAEEELRRFKFMIDNAGDAYLFADLNGRVRYANRTACQLLGYTEEELLNLAVFDVDPTYTPDRHRALADDLARVERVPPFETTLRRKDGSTVEVEMNVSRVVIGGAPHLLAVGRDISERRRAADAIRRTSYENQIILDSVPAMIWFKDANNIIRRVNRHAAEFAGLAPHEMEGRSAYDLNPGHAAAYHADDLEVIRTGRPKLGTMQHLVGADGHERWVTTDTVPYFDNAGRVAGVVVFSTDVSELRRAERERRRSEETLRLACRAAAAGAWDYDIAAQRLTLTSEFRDLFGLGPDADLTFRSWLDLVHPEDRESTADRLREALAGRADPRLEYRILRPDGAVRWIESTWVRISEPGLDGPRPVRLVGVAQDVTDRRLAAEALARSEGRLRAIFNQATAGIALLSTTGGFLEVNDRFCDLVGYGAAELASMTVEQVTHPDDREQIHDLIATLLRGVRASFTVQMRYLRKDGRAVWANLGAGLHTDDQGRPAGIVGVIEEADARIRAEDARRRSEERYRAMAENVPALVWTARPDGSCDYFNQRWTDFTGLTLDESLGWGWRAALHPDDLPTSEAVWRASLATGEPIHVQVRLRGRDGVYRWYLVHASATRDADGAISGWFGACTDIDEQKRAEARLADLNAALARSNRDLEDFAHIAAHDLREPLRGMRLCAAFLAEDLSAYLNDQARRHLASIDRLGKRMDDLVGSLLRYSIVGQTDLALASTDLNQLVANVLESLSPILRQTNTRVLIPAPLPVVRCDAVRVREVFHNLIANAVKYNTQPERRVEIGVRGFENGDTPIFYIRDNGIGIPPEHQNAVFRIFKRLHARDEFGGGTGSGLAIVKRIVERHGGRVWVESAVDEGSTFLFTLGKVDIHAPVEPAHSHH